MEGFYVDGTFDLPNRRTFRADFYVLHVTGAGSFPKPLSAEEERECLERMRHGDDSARAKLVEHNLRLVAHIAKKYYINTNEQDDLISIGTIGLIKAVSTFDCEKDAYAFQAMPRRSRIEKPIPS